MSKSQNVKKPSHIVHTSGHQKCAIGCRGYSWGVGHLRVIVLCVNECQQAKRPAVNLRCCGDKTGLTTSQLKNHLCQTLTPVDSQFTLPAHLPFRCQWNDLRRSDDTHVSVARLVFVQLHITIVICGRTPLPSLAPWYHGNNKPPDPLVSRLMMPPPLSGA